MGDSSRGSRKRRKSSHGDANDDDDVNELRHRDDGYHRLSGSNANNKSSKTGLVITAGHEETEFEPDYDEEERHNNDEDEDDTGSGDSSGSTDETGKRRKHKK